MEYPIYEVFDDTFDDFEDMGTKSKFWYTDPDTKEQYLFKSTHTEDKRGTPVIRVGDDWAEKIACEIAECLGIPHAKYDLANHNGEQGIRSANFSTAGDTLVFGNTLLERVTSVLKLELEEGQRCQEVSRVYLVLDKVIQAPPRDWINTQNINSAPAVFIGYLMLDCLISNQDRHNENWALIGDKVQLCLAPSFDHAASLGRNESDEKRQTKLTTRDRNQTVEHYVKKCKSHFYHQKRQLKTLEAFSFFSVLNPDAAIEWIERLEELESETIKDIVESVPNFIMSDVSKKFCIAIIEANKTRILNEKESLLKAKQREQ
ncbi:HipA domain-containing protein [Vibrio scophthalmi]|uniref:hypothetical protein n=1 Tax=Vibrio scophthalmi TaxID=45658 RepID=UPI003AAAEB0E